MITIEANAHKAKQPYAIAMRDGYPFGIGGLWENWKDPTSGEWIRTFAIITTDANELVAEIHDRMPLIIAPGDHRYQEHPALTELRQCTDDLSESLQRQTASRNDLDQSMESANGRRHGPSGSVRSAFYIDTFV